MVEAHCLVRWHCEGAVFHRLAERWLEWHAMIADEHLRLLSLDLLSIVEHHLLLWNDLDLRQILIWHQPRLL